MKKTKFINKKSYILLSTSIVLMFITFAGAYFVKYSSTITSQEFHKDLAKLRGYWATYAVKESNISSSFTYYGLKDSNILYKINASKVNETTFTWEIQNSNNSGIKDNMLFKRNLTISSSTDRNETLSYIN